MIGTSKSYLYCIFAFILFWQGSYAQSIPNNGFESWTNMGSYNNPDSWANLNDLTSASGVFTCTKGTPGIVGTAYLKLISKTVTGMGVMPGIAICGTMNNVNFQPFTGFPFTERPEYLSGKWQYMAFGSDQGFISVALTKWNTVFLRRDTVANLFYPLPGMVMSWENFALTLNYSSSLNPDSCFMLMSASQANGAPTAIYSYLYLDELGFSGLVSQAQEMVPDYTVIVSPNPSDGRLYLDFSNVSKSPETIEVFDLLGNKILSLGKIKPPVILDLDLSCFSNGTYLLRFEMDGQSFNKIIYKQ